MSHYNPFEDVNNKANRIMRGSLPPFPEDGEAAGMTRLIVMFERRDVPDRHPIPWKWEILNALGTWFDGTQHDHVEVYFPAQNRCTTSTARAGVISRRRLGYDLSRWDAFHIFITREQYDRVTAYIKGRIGEAYDLGSFTCFDAGRDPPPSCHGLAYGILSKIDLLAIQSAPCPNTPGGLSNLLRGAERVVMLQAPTEEGREGSSDEEAGEIEDGKDK